jgi:hypothetical protein
MVVALFPATQGCLMKEVQGMTESIKPYVQAIKAKADDPAVLAAWKRQIDQRASSMESAGAGGGFDLGELASPLSPESAGGSIER